MSKAQKTSPRTESKRSGSNTRKRNLYIAIRVNEEEYETIKDDANCVGLTMSSYMRSLAVNAPIPKGGKRPNVNRTELAKLLGHIGKIGSNLN